MWDGHRLGGATFALGIALVVAASGTANAFGGIGTAFQGVYPASMSDDNGSCQLCHGDGDTSMWNPYGWAIKVELDGGAPSDMAAILAVEGADSDGDPGGATNLEEINMDAQPGWTPGLNNTEFDGGGVMTTGLAPPISVSGDLDPPLVTTTTTTVTITTTITSTTSSTVTTTTTIDTSTTTTTLMAVDQLLSGKKFLLKDKAGKPQKRKVMVLSKDASVALGTGDPASSDDSSLRIVSTSGDGFDDTYVLNPANWSPIKKKDPSKGWKYTKGDPIKKVLLKTGKSLKIIGKGSGLGHSLGTDPQPVDVVLTVAGQRYCMQFATSDSKAFKADKKLLVKDAAAPMECPPLGSPSGAFID